MASELRRISDDPSRIVYRHPRLVGWLFAAVGAGLLVATWRFGGGEGPRWLLWLIGTVFTLFGTITALYRFELTLDLAGRRYEFRRGLPWSLRSGSGPLDELRQIILRQQWETRGSGKRRRRVCTWEVLLDFGEPLGRVKVVDVTDEEEAVRQAESLAERTGRPVLDATGEEPRRIEADELDRPLRDRIEAAGGGAGVAEWSSPRPESGVTVSVEAGRRVVTLPPRGFGLGLVLMSLLCLGVGVAAVLAGLGHLPTSDSPAEMLLVGSVFVLFGVFLLGQGVIRARSREWIRDEGDRLVFGRTGLGGDWEVQAIPKREIEDVGIVASSETRRRSRSFVRIGGVRFGSRRDESGDGSEIRVRSDAHVVRLGSTLAAEDRKWLSSALASMTVR